ncbi:hypothetical protein BP5796_09718 [Coleophoma crateriformis]|uniref:Xylanolytic transcriptional activator regulatory domain-containing protein n=1 Tax=Coleophoma crateriformis TaxID=565419 RepID=A0A3D8QYV8_9HELO|nr:hypothetical protein BP5796_09718 [Coleophoma crateriformis]
MPVRNAARREPRFTPIHAAASLLTSEKCDGKNPCGRCASQKGIKCIYEVPVRQSKENMRNEIEQLRKHQLQTDRILAALSARGRADVVLDQLRRGESLDYISDSIEKTIQSNAPMDANITTYERMSDQDAIKSALNPAQTTIAAPLMTLSLNDAFEAGLNSRFSGSNLGHLRSQTGDMQNWQTSATPDSTTSTHMPWTSGSSSFDLGPRAEITGFKSPAIGTLNDQVTTHSEVDSTVHEARSLGQGTILGTDFPMEGQSFQRAGHIKSWTNVTDDCAFVEHLLALYFCWEYPTFASLSKEHFLQDFRTGRPKFCSSLLVNSILSLGCRFSTQARARVNPEQSQTAGDHFFAEATRLLNLQEDRHVMTTVQALGLMSIREASCGRTSESVFLAGQAIRIAIEMGLHTDPMQNMDGEVSPEEKAVRAATFWGAFSLDQAWSLSIGRLPRFSKDTNLVAKPDIIDHVERSSWIPYTDDGAPLERNCMQPSNVRSVFATFCELSETVHQHLYTFYSPGNNVNSKELLDIYTKYLSWYDEIPSALRLGQNFTPAVLFAHMYYHFAILLLFRPFIKLKFTESSVSPSEVCYQAADAISALLNSYSRLYTLRRTPSFVPYFVLTSSITHLVSLGNEGCDPDKFLQTLADLRDMKGCHGFATRAYNIIRFLIHHWNVPIDVSAIADTDIKTDIMQISDSSENPEDPVKIKLDDQTAVDVRDLCRPSPTSANLFCPNMQVTDWSTGIGPVQSEDENPLFWPFPMQGKPMFGMGVMLATAGFAVLGSIS